MKRIRWAFLTIAVFLLVTPIAGAATTLRLTVQGPDGKAIAETQCKLELTVAAQPGQERSETQDVQTDAEGILDVTLPPLARYYGFLTVEGLGHAVFGPRFAPKDGETAEMTLKLTRSGCVLFRITRKDDGMPVANAQVEVANFTTRAREHTHEARSDRQGYCVVPDIAPGKCAVTVSALDMAVAFADVDVTGGDKVQRLEIALESGKGRTQYSGVVLLDDGVTPAEGAIVSLRRQNEGVRTDGAGRFSFDIARPLLHQDFSLRIWHEGYIKHEKTFWIEDDDDPIPFVTIVLTDRGGSLSGVVENADTGEPMRGETVVAALYKEDPDREVSRLRMEPLVADRLETYERYNWYGFDWPRTVTDDAGRYEFPNLAPGNYVIAVVPKDTPGGRIEEVIVENGKRTEDVTVRATAKPKGFIMLRFVNEKAEPLDVAFDYELSGGQSSTRGKLKAASNCCYLACHEQGERVLSVMAEGYAPLRKRITVDPAEFQEVVLTPQGLDQATAGAQERGALTGRVLQTDGKSPAEGVFIVPFTDNAPFPESDATILNRWRFGRRMCVTTDENGRFRIENLQPGKYGVVATPPVTAEDPWTSIRPELVDCLSFFSDLIEVKPGQTAEMRDVVFEKESVFDVRVVDAVTGKPLPKARARIFYTTPPSYYVKELYGEPREWHDADNRGNIHIRGLRAAEYGLEINCEGYKEQSLPPVAVGKAQTLALEPVKLRPTSGCAAGVIRLPDGTPAEGAKILTDRVSRTPLAVADAEGRFELDQLRPGSYTLYVTHPGFAWMKKWVNILPKRTPEIAIDMRVGGTIEARVLDEEGKPAGDDIRVVLVPLGWTTRCTELPQEDVFVSVPDADGKVRFEHVPPGSVNLAVLRNREVPRAAVKSPWKGDHENATEEAFNVLKKYGIFLENQEFAGTKWNLEAADGKALNEALVALSEKGIALVVRDALNQRRLKIADGETLELALTSERERGVVEGRAMRPDGTPVTRMTARFPGLLGNDRAKLDAEGRYRIECLPGRPSLHVEGEEESFLVIGVDVKTGETTTCDLTMGPYGTVSGKVVNRIHQPLSGKVTAEPDVRAITAGMTFSTSEVFSGKDGHFTLKNLLPGDYRVTFEHPDGRFGGQEPVTVEVGKDTKLEIMSDN